MVTLRAGLPGIVGAEPDGQEVKKGETMVTMFDAERGVSKEKEMGGAVCQHDEAEELGGTEAHLRVEKQAGSRG